MHEIAVEWVDGPVEEEDRFVTKQVDPQFVRPVLGEEVGRTSPKPAPVFLEVIIFAKAR